MNIIRTNLNDLVHYNEPPPTIDELLSDLEGDNLDSSFFYDVNLEPLLDYLREAGFSEQEMEAMNTARYGNFITIYYLKELELYLMEVGAN